MKLFLTPNPTQIDDANGVGKVVHAQYKYLPEFGIEFVSSPVEADVVAAHIQADGLPRVDCLHLHGLYWTGDAPSSPQVQYNQNHHAINRRIVEAARRAKAITIPGEWAAMPFKRDMRVSPVVIPNGVELDLWKGSADNGHYALWNKNRPTDVCDPTPALELARGGVTVISTYAPLGTPRNAVPANMRVVGSVPFAEMRDLIRSAELYLATTQEVFSLSVLEAMAAGIPILGYDWGGTSEAVRHKIEGYLVKPGDIDGLLEGWEWIRSNRNACSKAARKRAKEFEWRKLIGRYAQLYRDIFDERKREQHRTAVVITSYNYGHYLAEAIESVLNQTQKADEIVVVDDGSTDNTVEVAQRYAASGVKLIQQPNQGVANARNVGIRATEAEYIICLDADDRLHASYIDTLQPALQFDPALGVAWTKLAHMDEAGNLTGQVWDFDFKWEAQASPGPQITNGIPCAAMFRRALWERAGGYRQVYHPAEDAEFWTRGLATGFTARRVSDEPLFFYRSHPASASRNKPYRRIDFWHPWMKDRQYPFAAPAQRQPLVRSYSSPMVSVVIPVGPGHARYLPGALDSLLGQTYRGWEAIVVDDTLTSDELMNGGVLTPYPFAKIVSTEGGVGAGKARNLGLAQAKASLVVWLDADDYLLPTALEDMLALYAKGGGRYVYTDWLRLEADGEVKEHQTEEYDPRAWLIMGQHSVTVLMATEDARRIGGFDENLPGWEDWDFFIKCAVQGVHGVRLPKPLMGYRMYSGTRREESLAHRDELLTIIRGRYGAYIRGEKEIMACCGGNNVPVAAPASAPSGGNPGMTLLAFTGKSAGSIPFLGRATGKTYYAGNNPYDRVIEVDDRDVAQLLATGYFVQAVEAGV